jgi:RHS repeat-associated protein
MRWSSRPLTFVAALVLTVAGGCSRTPLGDLTSPAQTAPRGFVAAVTVASIAVASATTERAKENLASVAEFASRLTLGEQFDPNLGWYYLRARYYDPSAGRFATMDSWRGSNTDPASLHKYVYTRSEPVNRVDPSGLADTLISQGTAIAAAGIIASSAAIATNALLRFGERTAQQVIASRAAARECANRYRGTAVTGTLDCPGNEAIPLVFMAASQMPAISLHVQASQQLGRPALLNRTWVLKDFNRRVARMKCQLGIDVMLNAGESCDEYPFASTYQGGFSSTVAGVPLIENHIQGGVLSIFYTFCRVVPEVPYFNEFLVIPVLAVPPTKTFQCGR